MRRSLAPRGLGSSCIPVASTIKAPPTIFMIPKSLPRSDTDKIVATNGSKASKIPARAAEMYKTEDRYKA